MPSVSSNNKCDMDAVLLQVTMRNMENAQLREEAEERVKELEEQLHRNNIVMPGKLKELIAVLNAIYLSPMVDHDAITKKEFFERMAVALGNPAIAEYAKSLSDIKNAYKYDEIFDLLKAVATAARDE